MQKLIFVLVITAVAMGSYWLGTQTSQNQPAVDLPIPFRDGLYLGFINKIQTTNGGTLVFDDAVWLTGRRGEDAAIKAGYCDEETRSECLPNDYFIENTKKLDELLPLDPGVVIFMKTWDAGDQGIVDKEIGLEEFSNLINDSSLHWNKLPYNISIINKKVVQIEEVYIP